jgi:acetyl-CoA carboxylase biotin carboxyl carrier protein
MDLKEVLKLLELMEEHGLDEIEVEEGGTRIKLRKGGAGPLHVPVPVPSPAVAQAGNPAPTATSAGAAEAVAPEDRIEIRSPMVGTFYRAAAPDAEPFVSVGDRVTPDTVVCIIEAMKVMNEIRAEAEGEVVQILVESGEAVEYGQPLMVLRKSPST